MKQCPQCHRTYEDDFRFCLDDGTPLGACVDQEATWITPSGTDPDATWVTPPPAPTIPASTTLEPPAQPGPTAPGKSGVWKVLTAIAIAIGILIYAVAKIALWSYDREANARREDPQPAPVVSSSSPGATPTISIPIPTASLAPLPSASPTPPGAIDEPVISPGTYQGEFQATGKPEDEAGLRRIKLQFIFNAGGSYTAQGFLTIQMMGINDRLYQEERGSYTATTERITFRERMQRLLDVGSNTWGPWKAPDSGSTAAETIRNVTSSYFQMYTSSGWVTFSKL